MLIRRLAEGIRNVNKLQAFPADCSIVSEVCIGEAFQLQRIVHDIDGMLGVL